jgi:hypothetical protein
MARQRLDVTSAAHVLGISSDAVRKRVKRGTLPSEKDADGTLYVLVDVPADDPTGSATPTPTHLDSLLDQIAFLRAELERKDHLLAAALERIPALEEPSDARESPESASEGPDEGDVAPEQQETVSQPWWRRWFGG